MRRSPLVVAALSGALLLLQVPGIARAARADTTPDRPSPSGAPTAAAGTPELTTTTRLADRRSLVVGDRFFEMGTEDGSYPATGFHTRGEMGGFWSQPIKLLDGIWFGVDGSWLTTSSYTSGWGYQRMALGTHHGVRITRTDVAPDGVRSGLVGLRLSSSRARTLRLSVDAHSELMKVYPWGQDVDRVPDQTTYNLPDTGAVAGKDLVFREDGRPPVANAETHHYAALVGSRLTPWSSSLGKNHRGPQGDVVCPVSGDTPVRCDDTAYGKGTGGRLTYDVRVPRGGRTVWFAVAGSDHGLAQARRAQDKALRDPEGLLRETIRARRAVDRRTQVSLPGDRLLQRSVTWSKQNLAESVQEARNLHVRVTSSGKSYPAPVGTVPEARWIGAGFPDYPWLFATDGEYTGFAAVAAGQFRSIEDHLRALRDVSVIANHDSGKVVHEVTPDGSVFFGADADAGNTDETAKFPSLVALVWRWTGDDRFRDDMYDFAVRSMHYIFRELDADGDGWPEGLGNVETPGLGDEKLDNTVYTIRGLSDLADLARSKGDTATRRWASSKAAGMERRFDGTWWNGPDTEQYADSLKDPGNTQVFQRHWIGVTPAEAQIKRTGRPDAPLAPLGHARALVDRREEVCYSGRYGLFHTGTGATAPTDDTEGPACDSAVSSVPALRQVFTLNTSIMAVAEAALGRMGPGQLRRYTTGNATVQLDPATWELPGAMPEIAPSPDFGRNIDLPLTERSMALQAWGSYGILWPVVHYQLGVDPDIGRDQVRVVPQVPTGQTRVSGRDVRLGSGSVDVTAGRSGGRLTTVVRQDRRWQLTVGVVLPAGAQVRGVRLDGHRHDYRVQTTARGRELLAAAGNARGTSRLVVSYG